MDVFEALFPELDARMAGRAAGDMIETDVLVAALAAAFPLPVGFEWAGIDEGANHSVNLLRQDPERPCDVPDELLALKTQVLGDLRDGGSVTERFWARKANKGA